MRIIQATVDSSATCAQWNRARRTKIAASVLPRKPNPRNGHERVDVVPDFLHQTIYPTVIFPARIAEIYMLHALAMCCDLAAWMRKAGVVKINTLVGLDWFAAGGFLRGHSHFKPFLSHVLP